MFSFNRKRQLELQSLQSRCDAQLDRLGGQYEREIADLRHDRSRLLGTIEELSGALRDQSSTAELRSWATAENAQVDADAAEYAKDMSDYLSADGDAKPDDEFAPLCGPLQIPGLPPIEGVMTDETEPNAE